MIARPAVRVLSGARNSLRPALTAASASSAAHPAARLNHTVAATPKTGNKAFALGASATAAVGAWLGLGQTTFADEVNALDSESFKDFTLKSITPYNHDSHVLVFELPDGTKAGTFVASAVVFKEPGGLKDQDGNEVIRPYTPISSPDKVGELDFLIKEYPTGNMSKHVSSLKPGDKLGIKGPIPKWKYEANQFEEIGLISGGSGITPMWQLIQRIASDKNDKTKVTLLYSNKSEADILLREKFDAISKENPDQFNIVYGLDKAPANWPGFEGYLTPELGKKYLPDPKKGQKVHVFVCGPPGQMNAVSGPKGPNFTQGELSGLLKDIGYTIDQVYKF